MWGIRPCSEDIAAKVHVGDIITSSIAFRGRKKKGKKQQDEGVLCRGNIAFACQGEFENFLKFRKLALAVNSKLSKMSVLN